MLLKWEALTLWLSRVVPCFLLPLTPQYPPVALSDQAAHASVNIEMHRHVHQCSHRQRDNKRRIWQETLIMTGYKLVGLTAGLLSVVVVLLPYPPSLQGRGEVL